MPNHTYLPKWWERYVDEFIYYAKRQNFDSDLVDRCLQYAKGLSSQGLPIIYTAEHFSQLVGFKLDYVYAAAYSEDGFYREFHIPKKKGGVRPICEPLPDLKEIQRWLLDNIISRCPVSRFVKSYKKNQSIYDNARFHKRQKHVLRLDITDFFGSINYRMVYSVFKKLGYSKSISVLFANLCTLNDSLPQGAPTSPSLSNIVFVPFDNRISGYCLNNGIRYTRYADDLTFSKSENFDVGGLISFVNSMLDNTSFELNKNKTRLMMQNQRQLVTGIVVNQKLQAPRNLRRSLRQASYYIDKFGLSEHVAHMKETRRNYVDHLKGKANYVLSINPNDKDAKQLLEVLSSY